MVALRARGFSPGDHNGRFHAHIAVEWNQVPNNGDVDPGRRAGGQRIEDEGDDRIRPTRGDYPDRGWRATGAGALAASGGHKDVVRPILHGAITLEAEPESPRSLQ